MGKGPQRRALCYVLGPHNPIAGSRMPMDSAGRFDDLGWKTGLLKAQRGVAVTAAWQSGKSKDLT